MELLQLCFIESVIGILIKQKNMNGLFYCNEVADSTTLHLLRFYDNGYVIYKKVTGNSKDYLKKELKFFAMNGHTIVGQPEFTFCGAYDENGTTIKFKVENEIPDPSNSWAEKDILTFKGTFDNENTLLIKQSSKRRLTEIEKIYIKTNDTDLLNQMP